MTDTKPTLPELIEYQQSLCENYQPNPVVYIIAKEILASLEELAETKRLVAAADSFIELAFIAHPNLDLDIDAAIKGGMK